MASTFINFNRDNRRLTFNNELFEKIWHNSFSGMTIDVQADRVVFQLLWGHEKTEPHVGLLKRTSIGTRYLTNEAYYRRVVNVSDEVMDILKDIPGGRLYVTFNEEENTLTYFKGDSGISEKLQEIMKENTPGKLMLEDSMSDRGVRSDLVDMAVAGASFDDEMMMSREDQGEDSGRIIVGGGSPDVMQQVTQALAEGRIRFDEVDIKDSETEGGKIVTASMYGAGPGMTPQQSYEEIEAEAAKMFGMSFMNTKPEPNRKQRRAAEKRARKMNKGPFVPKDVRYHRRKPRK